jgi:hypothetical protein
MGTLSQYEYYINNMNISLQLEFIILKANCLLCELSMISF